MVDTTRLANLLEARPLTRSERHTIGDHRRCPPGCKRHGHDDRIGANISDQMILFEGWGDRLWPTPEQDEEYLRRNEGRITVRNGLLAAIPWLRDRR